MQGHAGSPSGSPQIYQYKQHKEIKETSAFLKLGGGNFPVVTLSHLFHSLNTYFSSHNILGKAMLHLQSHNTKREIRELQWLVCMHYDAVFNYIGPLPHSVHKAN